MQHWPLEDTQVIGPPQSAMAISPAPAAPTRPSPAREGRTPAVRESLARLPLVAASRAKPPDQIVTITAVLCFFLIEIKKEIIKSVN